MTRSLLVTDFDGTLTRREFFELAVQRLVPADLPDQYPGELAPSGALVMRRLDTPFASHELGVDKAAIVRDGLRRYERVAFAGDGVPDLAAARLVPTRYRFARGDLAAALAAEGLGSVDFERWADVVAALLDPEVTRPRPATRRGA